MRKPWWADRPPNPPSSPPRFAAALEGGLLPALAPEGPCRPAPPPAPLGRRVARPPAPKAGPAPNRRGSRLTKKQEKTPAARWPAGPPALGRPLAARPRPRRKLAVCAPRPFVLGQPWHF